MSVGAAGSRACLPSRRCVDGPFSPVLARDGGDAQRALSLQMRSLRPETGVTRKGSEARIFTILNVTGSLYDSGPWGLLLRAPSLFVERGCSSGPGPSLFCYLARKPGSCSEQVSADRPLCLPKIPAPDNPLGNPATSPPPGSPLSCFALSP